MGLRVRISVFFIIISCFCFVGCGKNTGLEEYKQNMEEFFAAVSQYDMQMNAIDPTAEDATLQLLAQLDGLTLCVKEMSELTVPEQFSNIEGLADEAYTNLNEATNLFHQYYESEERNAGVETAAKEYYERANIRFQYILDILHGEIPDDSDFQGFTDIEPLEDAVVEDAVIEESEVSE